MGYGCGFPSVSAARRRLGGASVAVRWGPRQPTRTARPAGHVPARASTGSMLHRTAQDRVDVPSTRPEQARLETPGPHEAHGPQHHPAGLTGGSGDVHLVSIAAAP